MDLEKLSARLRPRQPAEAMDLGLCMVREYAGAVLLPWLVLVGPVVATILWWQPGLLGVFLVWWLLPMFARIPLFVLSRALFGEVPGFWQVVRELPRMYRRFLWWPLSLGRLSPWWAFELPVTVLEQQRGARYRSRCGVLRQEQESSLWGLTVMCVILALCVWIGLAVSVGSLIEMFQGNVSDHFEFDERSETFTIPVWVHTLLGVSLVLVAPFHLASSFGLYLNRRLQLEGWDIELTFRRLATRIRELRPTGVGVLLPLLLSLFGALGGVSAQEPTQPASTQPAPTQQAPTHQGPQTRIEKILEHRDFGGERDEWRWRYIGSSPTFSGGPNLGLFAMILWVLMWVVGLGALAWILYLIVVAMVNRGPGRSKAERGPPPVEIMGLDVRPESLPEDPASEAWRLWLAGDAAGCLSLLYRGSLAFLIHQESLEIGRSFTEADCLRVVRASCASATSGYFGGLTSAWQSCAYAHRSPLEATAQQLCEAWPKLFGGAT